MMTGVITAIVLLQLPAWRIGRRVAAVAAVGAIGTIATYLTAVSLNILLTRYNVRHLSMPHRFVRNKAYSQNSN